MRRKFAGIVGLVMATVLMCGGLAREAFADYVNPIYVSGAYWGTYNLSGNDGFRHDILAPNIYGKPVYAIEDGRIQCLQIIGTKGQYQGKLVSYGNVIYFYANDGKTEARYAHLSGFAKCEPDYPESASAGEGSTYTVAGTYRHELGSYDVKKGEVIGYVGTTGNSSGAHLHFELWLNGSRVAPDRYISIDEDVPPSVDDTSARDKVAAYAEKIYNYTWTTDKYIRRRGLGGVNAGSVTGNIKGVPYTFTNMLSFADYVALPLSSKEKMSDNGYEMNYGMVCATLVTDCIRQGFPSSGLPLLNMVMFHKSRNSSSYTGLVSSVSDSIFDYDHTEAQWQNIWASIRTSQANSGYPAYQKLQKGDYLNDWNHVILVVANDTSARKITYIDQTPCWDDESAGMVGTHKGTYDYSRLSEKCYVPMYVTYPDDELPTLSGIKISDTFPDALFREYVSYWDTNNDGYFSDDEIDNVREFSDYGGPHPYNYWEGAWGGFEPKGVLELNVGTNHWKGIRSIDGVKIFRNLEVLYVHNDSITGTVDISGLTKLKDFRCWNGNNSGGITSINAQGCSALEQIQCRGNRVTYINRNGCNSLTYIDIYNDTAPTIVTETLPDAYIGIPYGAKIDAIGTTTETTPMTYTINALAYSYGFLIDGNPSAFPSTNGIINGTPGYLNGNPIATMSGISLPRTVNIKVTASNHMGETSKTFPVTLRETPVAPKIKAASLPDAYIGESYYAKVEATGTTPIYFKGGTGSTLANGIGTQEMLSGACTDGVIKGTPVSVSGKTPPYTLNFPITATNAGGSDSKTLSVTVYALPSIKYTFKGGKVGQSYSDYVSVSGGKSSYTWTKESGTIPPGLSMSPSGSSLYLKGTPTSAGTYSFKLKVKDANGKTATKDFTVTIEPSAVAPAIATSSLKAGTVDEAYSETLSASGTSPITWSATGLPSGLSCSSAGKITGTPTASGTFTVRLTASNTAGSATKTLSMTIKEKPVAPTIDAYLPACYVGEEYSGWIRVSGTSPITCTVTGLPSGLSRNSSTGNITGKATSAGSYTVRVNASNSAGAVSKSYTLTVKTRPVLTTITTTNLPAGKVGTSYSVALEASGTTPITWTATGLPGGLSCSSAGVISGTPTAAGTYTVNVTAKNSAGSVSKTLTLTINSSGGGENYDDGTIAPPIWDEVKPEYKNFSIMMEGTIGMNFYVYLPDIDGVTYTDENCWMDFDIRGDTSNVPQPYDESYSRVINSIKCRRFRCYINAAQMADTITATLHYGSGKTVTKEYSAKTYLDTALNTPGFSQIIKDLMISLKNYGHYVQPMLSKQNGWTIGDKYLLMEAHSEITDADIASARDAVGSYAFSKTINGTGVSALGYSLTFGAETTINIYITTASGYTGNVGAYLDGGTANMAVKLADGIYRVKISGIAARELGDIHTLEIHADKVSTAKISALSYAEAVLNSTAEKIGKVDIATMRKAVTALYQYHKAAKAYAETIK